MHGTVVFFPRNNTGTTNPRRESQSSRRHYREPSPIPPLLLLPPPLPPLLLLLAALLLLLALARRTRRTICLYAILAHASHETHLSVSRTDRAFTGARTRSRRTQSRTLGVRARIMERGIAIHHTNLLRSPLSRYACPPRA